MKKFAIVTGGSRDIGLAVARCFLEQGAEVLVVSNSSNIDFDDTDLTYMQLDLGDENAVSELINTVKAFKRPVDYLVNNPALFLDTDTDLSLNSLISNMQSNIEVITKITDSLLEFMNPEAVVINIQSSSGDSKSSKLSINKTAKNLVEDYSRDLAERIKDKSISIYSIDPKWTKVDATGQETKRDLNDIARQIYELAIKDK